MLKTLINGISYRSLGFWGRVNRWFYKNPKVMNVEESIEILIKNKLSVARFGDGEFNLMRGKELAFQKADDMLAFRLREILTNPINECAIGIPDVFGSLAEYEKKPARFWKAYMGMHRREMIKMLDLDLIYLNTNMTRFWTGYKNKEKALEIVNSYQTLWKDCNIVFVEGRLTRMGVGNDLFRGAASIKRILCPEKNAWQRYDEILTTILSFHFDKNTLFIMALGPTATVLAYDLAKKGYRALDFGHLDIQYEYSLKNAQDKIAIEGKYVNENIAGRQVSDSIIDDTYQCSILG